MKPLPPLADEAAMLDQGRRSALYSARKDAIGELRDAYTSMQSTDWEGLAAPVRLAGEAVARLKELIELWDSLP